MKTKPPAGYLNVDLEIEAPFSLAPLAEELRRSMFILYSGPVAGRRHLLSLETRRLARTADAATRALCAVVEKLSGPSRKMWARATRKQFDVGYELPRADRAIHVALAHNTLSRVVALGATVAFTCYRDHDAEPPGAVGKPE